MRKSYHFSSICEGDLAQNQCPKLSKLTLWEHWSLILSSTNHSPLTTWSKWSSKSHHLEQKKDYYAATHKCGVITAHVALQKLREWVTIPSKICALGRIKVIFMCIKHGDRVPFRTKISIGGEGGRRRGEEGPAGKLIIIPACCPQGCDPFPNARIARESSTCHPFLVLFAQVDRFTHFSHTILGLF